MILGEIIRRRIRDDKRSASEICDAVGMSRGNLDKIYKKEAINTDLLAKFCTLLNFDFFDYVNPFKLAAVDEQVRLLGEEQPAEFHTPIGRLQKCIGDLHDAKRELDQLEKEVISLRSHLQDKDQIIHLMKEKIGDLTQKIRKLEGN